MILLICEQRRKKKDETFSLKLIDLLLLLSIKCQGKKRLKQFSPDDVFNSLTLSNQEAGRCTIYNDIHKKKIIFYKVEIWNAFLPDK